MSQVNNARDVIVINHHYFLSFDSLMYIFVTLSEIPHLSVCQNQQLSII